MDTFRLAEVMRRGARTVPDKVALIEPATGRSITYRDLDRRASQVANGLSRAGVGVGSRVPFVGLNCIEYYELYFGAAKVGATFAPLNWNLEASEVSALIHNLGCPLTFVDPTFADRVDVSGRVGIGDEYGSWRDANGGADRGFVGERDTVIVQPYTSGTTGRPKGVQLTNENIEATIAFHQLVGFDKTSVQLASMPNYHIGGAVFPLLALAAAGQLVIVNRFSSMIALDMIDQYGVTNLNLVPTMIDMILDEQVANPRNVASLRMIVYGAAPITETTMNRAREVLGVALLQEYASTETLGMTLLLPDEHHGEHMRSVGRAHGGVEIEVRDAITGLPVPPRTSGEICARSPQCTPGYWQGGPPGARLYTPDGFIRTADMGHLDEQGYLYLTGRIGDMIITGAENVFPAEIENVLMTHADIADVAVIGTFDERWGEIVTAIVVPKPGRSVTANEIIEWSREQLTGYRRPRAVVLAGELPRNATGKLLRHELRGRVGSKVAAADRRRGLPGV